jgi:hypothetical protein
LDSIQEIAPVSFAFKVVIQYADHKKKKFDNRTVGLVSSMVLSSATRLKVLRYNLASIVVSSRLAAPCLITDSKTSHPQAFIAGAFLAYLVGFQTSHRNRWWRRELDSRIS